MSWSCGVLVFLGGFVCFGWEWRQGHGGKATGKLLMRICF